jgi:curved DNA-binding protein
MRARPSSEIASVAEARALLGLSGPVDEAGLKAAFRTAVKAARPDAPGGDETRFRKVIAAWRTLQEDLPALPAPDTVPARAPAPSPWAASPADPVIVITPQQALKGGQITTTVGTRTGRVRLPKGVRSGDRIRLKGAGDNGSALQIPVLIKGDSDLTAIGNDLYMTCPIPTRLLEDGGRLEIRTHAGPRSAWIVAGQQPLRLRLKDLGLPARGKHPQGHLFVTLIPSEDVPSAAEDLLVRFTRVWTPDRLAA